jgi:EAL domain-containing protein (putative c-di-GMP-specific phosphodiesterase class I)/DNA-binding response OmpR family regulator
VPAGVTATPSVDEGPPVVLVVDDDANLRNLYAVALRRAGFEILVAANGQQALEMVSLSPVGLVLCDVNMPGLTGFEVVSRLRAAPDTATLPVILITGTGDADGVIEGLAAGADDFLAKPVRLDELVARVRAHIRTRSAWLGAVQDELRGRFSVLSTLARIRPAANPEDTARVVIGELAERPDIGFAAVFQVSPGNRGRILASSLAPDGNLAATAPTPRRMRYLIDRARGGPWTESIGGPDPGEPSNAFWDAGFDVLAGAPIFWNERLVGFISIGRRRDGQRPTPARFRDLMLATAIDYAAVLSATIGPSLAARTDTQAEQRRLRRILTNREFEIAFQPIVDLATTAVVGFEALSRFSDGVPPDVRFGEAWAAGLGPDFELAAIAETAIRARGLPPVVFVGINVSPEVVLTAADRLRRVLPVDRPVVLEISEHVPIVDYGAFRLALAALGDVESAVDDAGAGFASMRHILELQPTFVKMDISLVGGINEDELRQALAAGLVYYGLRSGFRLIAEGVEDDAEAEVLRALGVDMAQGYLFGRPAPLGG